MVFKLFLNFLILQCLLSDFSWGYSLTKVLICGVCKNIEPFVQNTINNIEDLGSNFDDYHVVIYENNSIDNTKPFLTEWSQNNHRVTIISENLTEDQLSEGVLCFTWNNLPSRMELIAKARNKVLEVIREPRFDDYGFVVMADLDFQSMWPIDEVVKTLLSEGNGKWDCVSANGILPDGIYYDRYALRNSEFPFGPELLGDVWWEEIPRTPLKFSSTNWVPVFSAFGGLAIYKRRSILSSVYEGHVTEEFRTDCQNILASLPASQRLKYLKLHGVKPTSVRELLNIPIIFQLNSGYYEYPVCCEHVIFHASMRKHGFGKIFINPQMILRY